MAVAEQFEMVKTDSKNVACDGGKGALGHPRIYLDMGKNDAITCPYCSKQFVFEKQA